MLDSLRHPGLLRVAQRRDAIRADEATLPLPPAANAPERARRLVLLIARILAPGFVPSSQGALALMIKAQP